MPLHQRSADKSTFCGESRPRSEHNTLTVTELDHGINSSIVGCTPSIIICSVSPRFSPEAITVSFDDTTSRSTSPTVSECFHPTLTFKTTNGVVPVFVIAGNRKPGTVPNYPITGHATPTRSFFGRPGERGRRSRPTARPTRSMNPSLPNGVPRRVASRIRSSIASSSTPTRSASRQRSGVYH